MERRPVIKLHGGPAAGTYALRRAPVFMRAVVGPGDENDCLDQLGDEPAEQEKVYVYRQRPMPKPYQVHVRTSKGGGWYMVAEYDYLEDVDGEQLRDRAAWSAWVAERRQEVLGG